MRSDTAVLKQFCLFSDWSQTLAAAPAARCENVSFSNFEPDTKRTGLAWARPARSVWRVAVGRWFQKFPRKAKQQILPTRRFNSVSFSTGLLPRATFHVMLLLMMLRLRFPLAFFFVLSTCCWATHPCYHFWVRAAGTKAGPWESGSLRLCVASKRGQS